MTLIRQYAGLAMLCGAAMLLLPQGATRRTAMLAMGLIAALTWFTGVRAWLTLPGVAEMPASLLAPAASAGAEYAAFMSRIVSAQTGGEVVFTWENGGLAEGR